jgi:Mg2+ and Co2+ transporter CorA
VSICGMSVPLPFQQLPYAFWVFISISFVILAIVALKFIKNKK